MNNILVAIDSCETTTIASPLIERTIEMADAFSSKVRVLHVVPQSGESPYNIDKKVFRHEVAHELHEEHEFIHLLAKCMQDRDIDASSVLVEGATVQAILRETERSDIDLIILGCHKHSELFGTLMNDIDENLLSKCSHPVMFIPDSD